MPASKIRGDYEGLAKIAQSFQAAQDNATATMRNVKAQTEVLRGGDWIGTGATKFYQEMDGAIFPSLARLVNAMGEAARVTAQISQIIKQAEDEAARILDKEPGAAGNGGTQSVNPALGNAAAVPHGFGAVNGDRQPPQGQAATPGARDGNYTVGPPTKPNIQHDNGFSDLPKESPTLQDYVQLKEWRAILEASKVATTLGLKDFDDANDAYEHYLTGNGKDKVFSLDEYAREDPSGKLLFDREISKAVLAAERLAKGEGKFQIVSDADSANGENDLYPKTENWQKTIGAFAYWSSADVSVRVRPDGKREFTMNFVLNAEDRYNFNPNQSDIATKVPDAANGRFEVVGLAKPYMHHGQAYRTVTWIEGEGVPKVAGEAPGGKIKDFFDRGQASGHDGGGPRPMPTSVRGDENYVPPPWPGGERAPDQVKKRP